MLRILKDCRLCGVSVHAGETFPLCDFDDADVQILLGAGYAERFTPSAREAERTSAVEAVASSETPVEATEDTEPTEDTSAKKTPAKTARKRKK